MLLGAALASLVGCAATGDEGALDALETDASSSLGGSVDASLGSGIDAAGPLGMHPGMTSTGPMIVADSGPSLDAGVPATLDAASPAPNDAGADGGPDDGSLADAAPDGSSDASAPTEMDNAACMGGRTWAASDAAGAQARVKDYGKVYVNAPVDTRIIGLKTTLTVPKQPTTSSTLYAWPGLEPWPGGDNREPVGQGVLQPVLTWGTSCGTYAPTNPSGWWIAPQYVNPYTSESAFYGCKGGTALNVDVDDVLDISMSLDGTVWTQKVVDRQTGQMSSFAIDLLGQAQNWALFEIETPTQTRPVADFIFTSTTLTFADPSAEACQPSQRGASDYFSPPQSSPDGTQCCISKIVLRAQGVPATSPNAP